MTTNEEKLVGRIVDAGHFRDTMVAYVGLTFKLVLGVILDSVIPLISNRERECYAHDSLDGIAKPVGSRRNCTIRVGLGVLFEGIFPAALKVDKGPPGTIIGDGKCGKSVNKVCQILSTHV